MVGFIDLLSKLKSPRKLCYSKSSTMGQTRHIQVLDSTVINIQGHRPNLRHGYGDTTFFNKKLLIVHNINKCIIYIFYKNQMLII